jgi:hypothetical protein
MLTVSMLAGAAVVPATAGATNIGSEGCTPGYWKNHTENWEEYTSETKLNALFAFPAQQAGLGEKTMAEGLAFHGGPGVNGGAQILLRAATAAYLNAAHEGLGYPYRRHADPFNIYSQVNSALASQNRATMISLAGTLDAANNLGCPLS